MPFFGMIPVVTLFVKGARAVADTTGEDRSHHKREKTKMAWARSINGR